VSLSLFISSFEMGGWEASSSLGGIEYYWMIEMDFKY